VWFSGDTAEELAAAVESWIGQWTAGTVPTTARMPWLTWEQSAQQLLDVIFGGNWDAIWPSRSEGEGRKLLFQEPGKKISEEVN
jgi:hypothetical protein